jgi:hypothetical protein
MGDVALWLSILAGYVAMPILTIAAVVHHRRVKLTSTLILALGLIIATAGLGIEHFSTIVYPLPFDEISDTITGSGGVPAIWYVGGAIFSFGILMTCVGFVWYVRSR